jgi:hypothetical protein
MKNVTIIASAFKAENDLLTNYVNHKQAVSALANFGLKAKEAIGSYEGVQELSLVIDLETMNNDLFTKIKILFFNTLRQDTILWVSHGETTLVHRGNDYENLGKFHKVPEAEAKENGGFTFLEGEYYISKKENLPVWGERQSI